MSYEFDENGDQNVHQAQVPANVAGACPPQIIEYRIYAEIDFNDLFGNPPQSVIT